MLLLIVDLINGMLHFVNDGNVAPWFGSFDAIRPHDFFKIYFINDIQNDWLIEE